MRKLVLLGLVVVGALWASSVQAQPAAPAGDMEAVAAATTASDSQAEVELAVRPASPLLFPVEPIPASCLEFCLWYCDQEFEFCLSGCSDGLCELGCEVQWGNCSQDCYVRC